MFSLTNNPIIDTGIHVMEAWLEKRCDEIDEKDLKKIKKDIIKRYLRKDMQSHLSTIFTNNCAWCQPAYAGKPEKRVEEAGPLFDKINAPPLQPIRRCNSCSRDAVFELNRMYYPMMAGEDIFIYSPEGSSGIPICGECLFTVQAFPLGTTKIGGQPFFWTCPDPDWNYSLTKDNFNQNKHILNTNRDDKYPNKSNVITRMFERMKIIIDDFDEFKKERSLSIKDIYAIHFSNSGQGPDYVEYYIPERFLKFWHSLQNKKEIRERHQFIIKTNWREDKKAEDGVSTKNGYYEYLGKCFQDGNWVWEAREVVSKFYFLGRHKNNRDNLYKNNYELCKKFLTEVCNMDNERLEILKEFTDLFVSKLIIEGNEKRLIHDLFGARLSPNRFVNYIMRVQRKLSNRAEPYSSDRIFKMLGIVDEEDGTLRDAYLLKDLMLIRMFELIGKQNKDLLEDIEEEENNVD